MEIRYIRKAMTSYMVIDQSVVPDEWESRMIAHASLGNVLFAECICEDGRSDLWYDITGKQSLDSLLENKELGYDLLCRILMGIYDAAEGLEGILLRAEGLLLQPEGILGDYEAGHIWICYCQGNEIPLEKAFLQLMEYLLAKLSHEDARAVDLAYGLYGEAAKSGFSIRRIKEEVRLFYQQEEAEEEIKTEPEAFSGMTDAPGIEEETIEESQKCKWKTMLQRCLSDLREKMPQRVWVFLGNPQHKKASKEREEKRFVFEPEEEKTETVSRPTMLLAELTKKPEGILRYEGTGQCGNLTIEGGEYLIGSDPACSGYIPSKTVSRKHARITHVEDFYFLEDLNSSNGTYVGGEALNYKTKMSLQKNEVVAFADEKFRFI